MSILKRESLATALLTTLLLGGVASPAYSAPTPRYIAVDVGTLGGPNAFANGPARNVSEKGVVVGSAETPVINPFPQECDGCHAANAFEWRNGIMTDLGNLGGYNAGLFEINARGVGAGFSETGALDPLTNFPQVHAAMSSHGRLKDLGTLGGNNSWASAINNRGDIAGMATNTVPDPYASFANQPYSGATQWRAVRWHNGVIEDLGTLGGPDSVGPLINQRGQVAGESFTNSTANATTGVPTWDPFIWSNGRMTDLGSLGGTVGYVSWLNNSGEVAGQSNLAGDQTSHPFLWNGKRMIDLGTLGGEAGHATWVSDSGLVVGSADTIGNQIHDGFLWKNGTMYDLPPVDGNVCSNANSVNNRGDVVGNATNCHGGNQNAVLWRHGHAFNLNDLIAPSPLHLVYAEYVNNHGEILAAANRPNGDTRIVLLTPTAMTP